MESLDSGNQPVGHNHEGNAFVVSSDDLSLLAKAMTHLDSLSARVGALAQGKEQQGRSR